MEFLIKYKSSLTQKSFCEMSSCYSGYMNKIMNLILNPDITDVELEIGDFKFDVSHLRTLLK